MSVLPVSMKRLADCTVVFRDASLPNCALLPLFDAKGVTAKVAILSARTREYWILDWQPDLVQVPLVRAVRVNAPRETSSRSGGGDLLWLYDPRGLIELGLTALCGGAVAGNAAEVLPTTVTSVTWKRDLSRITNVWLKKKGGGDELGRWKADWLTDASPRPTAPPHLTVEAPRRPTTEEPVRSMRGWVLDPIWTR